MLTKKVDEDTLLLVHVIFRHGNRTPHGKHELYPNDPHYNKSYFPIGLGQLTNIGKQNCYQLGKKLREKYDTFLGQSVYNELVEATSTYSNRTKVSLQYCLAGLFPPRKHEIWNENLKWQAFPTNATVKTDDRILFGVNLSDYKKLFMDAKNSPRFQKEFKLYETEFRNISKESGLCVTSFTELYHMYLGVHAEVEYGLELPDWLKTLWPENITNLAVKHYSIASATPEMNKLSSGCFLNKLIDDTKAKIMEDKTQFKKKLYLYCAHDSNIALLLATLGIFDQRFPKYASYISFEVHKIDEDYGFKIYYQNYEADEPILMKLPECDQFCSLTKFIELFKDILP